MLQLEPLPFEQWKELNFPLFDEQIKDVEKNFSNDIADGYKRALEVEYNAYQQVERKNMGEIEQYNKDRTIVDYQFIASLFEKDERAMLNNTQQKFPNSIIRMPNADLIASGIVSGVGGSVSGS